jgi:hypothetical protein
MKKNVRITGMIKITALGHPIGSKRPFSYKRFVAYRRYAKHPIIEKIKTATTISDPAHHIGAGIYTPLLVNATAS